MDKLRALQYFNRAVETGSFAAAARSLDVSTPAVTHLIAALERAVGAMLLYRSTRGISLTAAGERYYQVTRAIAAQLGEVEMRLGTRGADPRGTLTVGMFSSVGQHCVMPRIGRFLARYPDVELVLKVIGSIEALESERFDLALMTGWPPERDFVVRPLAQARNLVCASPEYWRRAGTPQRPEDLRAHQCIVFRSVGGAILDRWTFVKDGERRTVDVGSRLVSDASTWVDEAACAGAGVVRRADLSLGRYLATGMLVPALTDWEALDAPTYFAAYRRGQRQSKLVRAFLEFAAEVFAELERERQEYAGARTPRTARPEWFGRARGRQSAFEARRRKAR